MTPRYTLPFTLCLFTAFASPVETVAKEIAADICVYGGSEAGFTAAIAAARAGKSVVLIEPTGHPGGMLVEGLCGDIQFGNQKVVGGICREVYQRIDKRYGRDTARTLSANWRPSYEPHVAEEVVEAMLAEQKKITIIRGKFLAEDDNSVVKQDNRLREICLDDGTSIAARVFIDASIEGDLLHAAGVATTWGRESNAKYGETKNGIRDVNTYRQFAVKVDPYIVPGEPSSGLIATIQDEPLGTPGEGDKSVMGYCFRFCLTKHPQNVIPIAKPKGYDKATYEIYRRYLAAGGKLFSPGQRANVPRGKTDMGSWHDLSLNLYGMNRDYPTGDQATRAKVYQRHKDFSQGLFWFLQNDPDVPESTKDQWRGWGLCKDEFTDNDGWPRRIYVRSARRMVSDYVVTEHHTRKDNDERVADPAAIAYWPPDTHHARRIVRDGFAYNEGFVFGGNDWRPFGVSYRALVPKRSQCDNLLTPTCPSSSYVAYGAIRILWTFMVLGESTGIAAAMAAEDDVAVQAIDYQQLRKRLNDAGQILAAADVGNPAPKPVGPQVGATGIAYTNLPPGARLQKCNVGASRCSDRFEITEVPAELQDLDLLTVPRGDGLSKPGTAWKYKVDRPVRVYSLCMNRGQLAVAGWKRTEHQVNWRSGDKPFSDTVYTRDFPAGEISIPAHIWQDEDKAYGIPHACVVIPK